MAILQFAQRAAAGRSEIGARFFLSTPLVIRKITFEKGSTPCHRADRNAHRRKSLSLERIHGMPSVRYATTAHRSICQIRPERLVARDRATLSAWRAHEQRITRALKEHRCDELVIAVAPDQTGRYGQRSLLRAVGVLHALPDRRACPKATGARREACLIDVGQRLHFLFGLIPAFEEVPESRATKPACVNPHGSPCPHAPSF